MEVSSKYKYIRISAQKCRLIADQVRGLPVDKALNLLKFSKQRAARFVQKTLNSAIANAENNEGENIFQNDSLMSHEKQHHPLQKLYRKD